MQKTRENTGECGTRNSPPPISAGHVATDGLRKRLAMTRNRLFLRLAGGVQAEPPPLCLTSGEGGVTDLEEKPDPKAPGDLVVLAVRMRRHVRMYFSIVRRSACWAPRVSMSTSLRITTLKLSDQG